MFAFGRESDAENINAWLQVIVSRCCGFAQKPCVLLASWDDKSSKAVKTSYQTFAPLTDMFFACVEADDGKSLSEELARIRELLAERVPHIPRLLVESFHSREFRPLKNMDCCQFIGDLRPKPELKPKTELIRLLVASNSALALR